jgi:hypothetical protein
MILLAALSAASASTAAIASSSSATVATAKTAVTATAVITTVAEMRIPAAGQISNILDADSQGVIIMLLPQILLESLETLRGQKTGIREGKIAFLNSCKLRSCSHLFCCIETGNSIPLVKFAFRVAQRTSFAPCRNNVIYESTHA